MHNYGIKQPVVCCIMRGQDSTLTGLLPLESFGSLIRILNLLISTDSSSVVFCLNRYGGTHFQEYFPYLKNHSLDECHVFRFRHITSQGILIFQQFFVHESQDDSN